MISRFFFYLGKDILLLVICSLLSLIILLNNKTPQILSIKSIFSDIVYIILYPQRVYFDLLDVKKENELLRGLILKNNLDNSLLNQLVVENMQLKEALDYNNLDLENKIYPSFVTAYNVQERESTIIINNHKEIIKNAPVIDMFGLVGRIISRGLLSSQVQLISDKNFRLSVRVGKNRSLGIYKSTNGVYGILEGVRKSVILSIGDTVYTSGISKIYPKNIPVAKVIHIGNYDNQIFQSVEVEVLANINNLEYVYTLIRN